MRDVEWGWLIRYMHSTGASAFFIVVYLHMFRGMLYGSYKTPRELIWIFGVLIYLCLMGEAFFGYLLPWGQMSYWGAQVIISLFGAIPVVGDDIALWIRGDYVVSDATLNRFFAFHVIALPLVLVMLVFVHVVALHKNLAAVRLEQTKNQLQRHTLALAAAARDNRGLSLGHSPAHLVQHSVRPLTSAKGFAHPDKLNCCFDRFITIRHFCSHYNSTAVSR